MTPLALSFYLEEDVVSLGKKLLGKTLYTLFEGQLTGGKIVETESYAGAQDRASHAFKGRFTPRTKTLYEEGGISYVYLCYGIHSLLNVVTNKKGIPHAVLIRAIEPLVGIDIMLQRTKKPKLDYSLTSGPGSLTKALGIHLAHNGLSFQGPQLFIEDGPQISKNEIISSPRVGVSYAEKDALLPWRFRIQDNHWTGKSS